MDRPRRKSVTNPRTKQNTISWEDVEGIDLGSDMEDASSTEFDSDDIYSEWKFNSCAVTMTPTFVSSERRGS